jgi:tripartite-type tricarboxylate transporter receptor subunit TctC
VKLPRRSFLHLAAGAAALPAVSRIARADAYPTRPVRLLVGYPAGLAPDIVGRLVSQRLSERLGQPFVVENHPGAGTNIATEAVVRSPPDGYTLLLVSQANAVNATLYDNLNFDFIRDIAPVATIFGAPFVLVVNPSFPAKTVPEFIAYAKANPGNINYVSPGIGTASHVYGELFKMTTGVSLVHVPYRTNFVPDLLAGQTQVAFTSILTSIAYIRDGKLCALAVTTATRSNVLPDIPVMAEFVAGYEASSWSGIGAPRNTPAEIIDKLNEEINAALADLKMKARLADLGIEPMSMTPAGFSKLIAEDIEKWAKVIKFAGIKPE